VGLGTWQVRLFSLILVISITDSSFAVQYGLAVGAQVLAVDSGSEKEKFVKELGVNAFIDFAKTKDLIQDVNNVTSGGAHAVIVTAGSPRAFKSAADMLRVGGILSCVGIPPGKAFIEVPVCTIVIKGLRITGNLVGSLKECLEAVELVRRGVVKVKVSVRPFKDLPAVYEELERGDIAGRIVLKVNEDN
jgi:propanol-preferring alcohol dehydrogenase